MRNWTIFREIRSVFHWFSQFFVGLSIPRRSDHHHEDGWTLTRDRENERSVRRVTHFRRLLLPLTFRGVEEKRTCAVQLFTLHNHGGVVPEGKILPPEGKKSDWFQSFEFDQVLSK